MNKDELLKIIGTEFDPDTVLNKTEIVKRAHESFEDKKNIKHPTGMWAVSGGTYWACENTVEKLPPGIYTANYSFSGEIYFAKQNILSDEIIELPDDNSAKVLRHIEEFRNLQERFQEMGYLYKRGILLYGPQGGGKTCTIIQTIRNFVQDGGIVLLGNYPKLDSMALHLLRDFEEDRPLLAIYEDLDEIIYLYGDRSITSLLDGEANINNILFIATTNYPERLPPRLLNRPSRFDIVQYIGLPGKAARKAYLMHKIPEMSLSEISVWVEKTDGLTIPHLKELIILVKVYGKELDESIQRLKDMSKLPHSRSFTDRYSEYNISLNIESPVEIPTPTVNVDIPPLQVDIPQPIINFSLPKPAKVKRTIIRDDRGLIKETIDEPIIEEEEEEEEKEDKS